MPLSDDFRGPSLGLQWSQHGPRAADAARLQFTPQGLRIEGRGQGLADCAPLTCVIPDRSYELELTLQLSGPGHGGLALFYDERAHVGLGFSGEEMLTYGYGQEQRWMRQPLPTRLIHIRLRNRENVLSWHYSTDGAHWQAHPWQMEVSGLHHNVFGGFVNLRVALFSAGTGEVRLRRFTYRGLD